MPLFEVAANTERFGAAGSVGLASCLQANSRVGQAEEVLRDALARFPDDYRVLVEAANLSNEQGEYSKAESLLEKEIALGSNRREVRYAYAVALRGLGRVDEARVHFDYSAEAATQTAEANRRAADVASRPNDARLRFEIGNIHLRYGNIEDGLIWIHSALEISPDLSHAHDSLARYYESQISRDPRYIPLARKHRLLASADNAATRKDS
jgi:tetratricopeptide (TPR) repeat protein